MQILESKDQVKNVRIKMNHVWYSNMLDIVKLFVQKFFYQFSGMEERKEDSRKR
jgi:hypothetical protein